MRLHPPQPSDAVTLYRCSNLWVKFGDHPCRRVQKALDEAGVEYEIVKGPYRKSDRTKLEQLSGQRMYPVILFEDGVAYREHSKDMQRRSPPGS